MGVNKILSIVLLTLLFLLPIQDQMKTWKRKFKHPNPIYLTSSIPNDELDTKPRYFRYSVYGFENGKCIIIWTGNDAWRPDPDAEIDELKATLNDAARKEENENFLQRK